jgi:hypothetical protein
MSTTDTPAGATRTTVTETETTRADGTVEKSRVVVTEVAPAAGRSAPTSVAEVAEQTVGDLVDVVERGVAVAEKIRGFAKLAGTVFGGSGGKE